MIGKIFSVIIGIVLMISVGCAPAPFIPIQLPETSFEATKPYTVDISTIPKPDKLKPIFVNAEFENVDAEKAAYVLLVPAEYAKIAALLKLCKAYKEVINEQGILINYNIDIINSLKEFVALEQMKAGEYRKLWTDSENAYAREKYYNNMNNIFKNGVIGTISIGAILIAILAL